MIVFCLKILRITALFCSLLHCSRLLCSLLLPNCERSNSVHSNIYYLFCNDSTFETGWFECKKSSKCIYKMLRIFSSCMFHWCSSSHIEIMRSLQLLFSMIWCLTVVFYLQFKCNGLQDSFDIYYEILHFNVRFRPSHSRLTIILFCRPARAGFDDCHQRWLSGFCDRPCSV